MWNPSESWSNKSSKDLGHSKNVKDWTIRSQVVIGSNINNYAVKRLNGIGYLQRYLRDSPSLSKDSCKKRNASIPELTIKVKRPRGEKELAMVVL